MQKQFESDESWIKRMDINLFKSVLIPLKNNKLRLEKKDLN